MKLYYHMLRQKVTLLINMNIAFIKHLSFQNSKDYQRYYKIA